MKRRIIIEERRIIEEEAGWSDPRPFWPLYEKLDLAQAQARRRAEYIARCPCNPANGGSGICGCVIPGDGVWCNQLTAALPA
jgi:hypothetical protein